jgi:hypothetical protein
MKFIFFSLLFTATSAFASNSDSEIVNTLSSYLDMGTYIGKDHQNKKCIVTVSEFEKPPQKHLPSQYMVEVFSSDNYGWYAFITNRTVGGRGDCANIQYDNGSFLKVQNSGSSAPCFSNSKKSTDKGLQVVDLKDGRTEVITLDSKGLEESICTLSTVD